MLEHKKAAFTTLTYDEANLPLTLQKHHLQLFLRRLRKRLARQKPARTIRFFAAGEYGEKLGRPHYHAILYGASEEDSKIIQETWPHGGTYTVRANAKSIAYVAGYSAKKYGDEAKAKEERVDEETGEVYNFVPPFLQMSLKPGIGGNAKKKFRESWRHVAIHNGRKEAVPRYLHEGWKATATNMEKEILENEKHELMKTIKMTEQQRKAAEAIAIKEAEVKAAKRQRF